MSHNIGGALAGMLALWGANTFFGGNVLGMFIFPALIALVIGVAGLFIGKDDPEELGWNRCEEIFGEPVEAENAEADEMPMWQAFKQFVLRNPWIWILCIANVVCVYRAHRHRQLGTALCYRSARFRQA